MKKDWKYNVILVSGKKQAGKDTFASVLKNLLPNVANILHFADALKRDVYNRFPVDKASLYGTGEEKEAIIPALGISGRKLMQDYGSFMASIYDPIWADVVFRDILDCSNASAQAGEDWIAVVPDARRKAEMQVFAEYNVTELKIVRPGQDTSDTHESEVALDDHEFEYVLRNEGTLEDFRIKSRNWIIDWLRASGRDLEDYFPGWPDRI